MACSDSAPLARSSAITGASAARASAATALAALPASRTLQGKTAAHAHARAIFDPRQGIRIDGENRSRPWQQGNMEANGSEVAKVRADRGQCDFNSAPGQRLKLASKTGARLVAAESAEFAHIMAA